jgi:drug/metabolite transporter (DMT)-like permease
VSVAVVLGLAAAFAYGLGDFLGGLLARRMHFAVVAIIAGAASLVVTLVGAVLIAPADIAIEPVAWGAASGIGTAVGTLALYRGLSRGRMGVVAPLSAVGAAAIPVLLGVILGERPSLVAWLGVALAIPAIALVSMTEQAAHPTGDAAAADGAATQETPEARAPRMPPGVFDGLLAGLGFAVLFVGLKLAGDGSGLWPVIANQVAALVLFLVALIPIAGSLRRGARSRDVAGAVVVGLIGAGASVAYFLATQAGLLSIVVVLTALYPAVTVVLAVLLTKESIGRLQAVGLATAAVAVGLIVLG